MCGLYGELGHSLINKNQFMALNALSKNRGPDMSGYWTDNHFCQLGFNRLSILDLSENGNQPMISKKGRWVILMNGEVYNFKDIRNKLGKTKSDFISRTDTEIVLFAFENWGIHETLKQLNGIYAIALFDIKNRQIHLIRDFAGTKPLYFAIINDHLVFASQYDQLFKHPIISSNLRTRYKSLSDFIRMGYIPAPNAFFENTWQVRPGEIVSVNSKMNISKYIYYSFPNYKKRFKETDNQTIDQVDSILSNVIKNQKISDVSVGAFLSGGIDSPLICSYLKDETKKLDTFTIGSKNNEYDESYAARDYSNYIGSTHHLYKFSDKDIIKNINEHFLAYSEPFGDYSSIISYQVCKNAREKFTVALGGDGGDEIFWGYPRFTNFTSHRYWFNLNATSKQYLSFLLRKCGFDISYGISAKSIQYWVLGHHSHNNYDILAKILPEYSNSSELFQLYNIDTIIKGREEILIWLRNNEFYGHLQRVLLKMDRASMYHGLEVRVPFLDKNVIKFASQIEPELLKKHDTPKYILKKIMSRRYPKDIIQQEKKGFSFNLNYYLKGLLKDELFSLLVERDPYPRNTFNRLELNKYIYDYYNNKHNNVWGIWILYALQKWADCFELHN